MERITSAWRGVLDIYFESSRSKSKTIAFAIRAAILSTIIPLDSPVPPYRIVALYLRLKKSVVGEAWRILVREYQLFESSSGGGTRVVAVLPGSSPQLTPVKKSAGHG